MVKEWQDVQDAQQPEIMVMVLSTLTIAGTIGGYRQTAETV